MKLNYNDLERLFTPIPNNGPKIIFNPLKYTMMLDFINIPNEIINILKDIIKIDITVDINVPNILIITFSKTSSHVNILKYSDILFECMVPPLFPYFDIITPLEKKSYLHYTNESVNIKCIM